MTDLLTRPVTTHAEELDTAFYMKEIEVDGIVSKRRDDLHSNYLFTVKAELNDRGEPRDTGKPMYWKANIEISEHHWLQCGSVIPKHSLCGRCGKRLLDE